MNIKDLDYNSVPLNHKKVFSRNAPKDGSGWNSKNEEGAKNKNSFKKMSLAKSKNTSYAR